MVKKNFYITTPIYYVNAKPHIGHAYTTIAADVLARFHKVQGEDVFFLTGTDEHGLNIQKKAEEAKKEPQIFADENTAEFKKYWEKLGIKYDNFIRTTDEKHKAAVQKALQALYDKGAIYKGEYEGYYCVACEQFKNERDLVDGRCPDHDIVVEKVKEECYLLKMSGDVQKKLIEKIKNDEFRIAPEKYKNEALSFLESQDLRDVSISRKNVSWGVELPFDKEHTTYVWADAFLNYLTGLGWHGDPKDIPSKWPADVHLIGKDILRVHATIWPIMLMHLGIEFPKLLFVHGYLLSGGRKMSKTIGNVVSIDEMLEKFGVDGTRYLLMSAGTFGEDVDMTMERMVEKYNADLANGLGNLLSRIIKMSEKLNHELKDYIGEKYEERTSTKEFYKINLEDINLCGTLVQIWEVLVRDDDKFIEENKPWELAKSDKDKFEKVMEKLILDLNLISELVIPFMPETSEKIKKALETKKAGILFPRIK
ncbi:MAG: methionine--tRNA ligase [Candidatus Moranbacteria bacterium RIFOXYB1_FULL_43_19]|nr:MAG: methionine--tRNA ligase [Candidatus Moranbacteria bacterium RIFOXYA1_FULL_44_7]OGI26762.1 MAG: methionine--tRNA ligase [Candidatus Moranbacteria bacterium RIFOXYB1_FULL_43_19]OGI32489.1 MAG: methionine--tRNA ligase [Candidatus Moranbacteria bacterium RIFOXYC1_FULL_44_13]